jgi:hypothetical protein
VIEAVTEGLELPHRRARPRAPAPERKLIAVKPLRPATELSALQALNDRPETLDLSARSRQLSLII